MTSSEQVYEKAKIRLRDRFTRERFLESDAGLRCVELIADFVGSAPSPFDFQDLGEKKIDQVVESIYGRLPSGDYGRGDVRRVLESVIG